MSRYIPSMCRLSPRSHAQAIFPFPSQLSDSPEKLPHFFIQQAFTSIPTCKQKIEKQGVAKKASVSFVLYTSHSSPLLPILFCLVEFSAFLGRLGFFVCLLFLFMATPEPIPQPEPKKDVYSVWAVPPEDVRDRMQKLMSGLRSEFGGPEFEPHITVVGSISLTADDALKKLRSACEGLKAYNATVDRVATGTFFYQCVYLLIHPTTEVVETSNHCISHFGYQRSSPYMPHLSLLYGDLSDEEKKKAQERANTLDDSLSGLSFQISRLALYKTDTEDKTLKSWEKIAECTLSPN